MHHTFFLCSFSLLGDFWYQREIEEDILFWLFKRGSSLVLVEEVGGASHSKYDNFFLWMASHDIFPFYGILIGGKFPNKQSAYWVIFWMKVESMLFGFVVKSKRFERKRYFLAFERLHFWNFCWYVMQLLAFYGFYITRFAFTTWTIWNRRNFILHGQLATSTPHLLDRMA